MLIDAPQTTHAEVIAELMEHPRRGATAAQPGEPSPSRLLGQLRDDKIERMGGSQQRQQMHAPELRRDQSVATDASAFTRAYGHVRIAPFEQHTGADSR